jgi:hypothetical protein
MQMISSESYWAKIFIAGPILIAEQSLRELTFEGLCVNVYVNKYIYKGGEETGYVVELINYPRFPCTPDDIRKKAFDIGNKLMIDTYQSSFTVMYPDTTEFYSRRDW